MAAADPEPSPAQRRFSEGLELFAHGDYARASAAFEDAHALDPALPAVLYSWAQAERLGGRCAHAIELYGKYRAGKVTPSQDAAARDGTAQCEKALQTAHPAGAPGESNSGWLLRWPDDAFIGGGVLAVGVGALFFTRVSAANSDATTATTLDDFHAALGRASRDRIFGVLALAAGAGLVGTGVYLRLGHHDVVAATDGRSVMIGARF